MESGEVLVGERVGSLGIVDGFLREGGCRGGPLPVAVGGDPYAGTSELSGAPGLSPSPGGRTSASRAAGGPTSRNWSFCCAVAVLG